MSQCETAAPTDREADRHRQVAMDLDRKHAFWMVIWGCYSYEYIAFPLFKAPGRIILHTIDPEELVERMHEVEQQVAQDRRTRRAREYGDM